MKLRLSKKQPERREPGRQRRYSLERQAPSAFSYHAKRSERPDSPGRQQPSLAEQRHRMLSLQFWLRRSGLLIAVVAGLICLISILSLSNQPRIVLLDQQTDTYAFNNTETYQQSAAEYLSGSIWNRNKLTINAGAAAKDLKQQYPELADVTITLPLIGHRPIYYLQANAPAFVMQTVNGRYVLDSAGTVLIAADAAPDNVVASLPVLTDQTGTPVSLGHQVIGRKDVAFIQTVVNALSAKQVRVSSLVLPSGAVQQLDVRVEGQPYVIKFNMHDSTTARQQVGTYLATAAELAGQRTVPTQYIDVRVLGRAYYQ